MDTHLVELIYVSRSVRFLNEADLESLLESARKTNKQQNVTGILLYKDTSFIQYLEGSATAIDLIMERINRDPLHYNIRVLIDKTPLEARRFEHWWMGFPLATNEHSRELSNFVDFLSDPEAEKTSQTQSKAMQLINYFRRNS